MTGANERASVSLFDSARGEYGQHTLFTDRPHQQQSAVVVDHELPETIAAAHGDQLMRQADGRSEHRWVRRLVVHRAAASEAESVDRGEDGRPNSVDGVDQFVEDR